jgi:hypothetical protein
MNTAAFNTEGGVRRRVLHVEWRVSAPMTVEIRKEPRDLEFATFEERHPWESCCLYDASGETNPSLQKVRVQASACVGVQASACSDDLSDEDLVEVT